MLEKTTRIVIFAPPNSDSWLYLIISKFSILKITMTKDRRGRWNFKQKCKPLRSKVEGHCANFSPSSRFRNGCHGRSRSWNGKSGRMLTINKRSKATKILYKKYLPQKSAFVSEKQFSNCRFVSKHFGIVNQRAGPLLFARRLPNSLGESLYSLKVVLGHQNPVTGNSSVLFTAEFTLTEPSGPSFIISGSRVQGAKASVT